MLSWGQSTLPVEAMPLLLHCVQREWGAGTSVNLLTRDNLASLSVCALCCFSSLMEKELEMYVNKDWFGFIRANDSGALTQWPCCSQ